MKLSNTQVCRAFAAVALGVLLLAGCRTEPEPPNILLITVDTLRADRVGVYGFPLARTPTMDRLAAEGTRFADAITTAPITLPAHASMLTGRIPPAHGVRDNGIFTLDAAAETVAERLREAGYATQAFVSAEVLNRRYQLDQGFEHYDDAVWDAPEAKMFMIRYRPAAGTIDRVLDWYADWREQPDRRPFFTWVHLFDPHQPLQPPAAYRLLTPSLYDAEIAYADDQLGRLLEALRRDDVLDETLVIVTADHGESLGEHGEDTHGVFIYDATVHVPLIIRHPGRFPAGRVYEGPVRVTDIGPTALAAAGLEFESKVDGVDLRPLAVGREIVPLLQYSESMLPEYNLGLAGPVGIRDGRHKFIRLPRPELYDLQQDPSELENLHDREPLRVVGLEYELDRLIEDVQRDALSAGALEVDADTRARLESLGYVQAGAGERSAMQRMDPKDGLALYGLLRDARQLAQEADWTGAETVLREILVQMPDHPSANSTLGKVLLEQRRPAEALEYYRRALEIWPEQDRVLLMVGQLEFRLGQLESARAHLDAALALNPGFIEPRLVHSQIALRSGEREQALRWLQDATEVNPDHPRAWIKLGDFYFVQGRHELSMSAYRRGLELQPQNHHARNQLGLSKLRVGRLEQALAEFEQAERVNPEGWVAAYNAACALAGLQRPDEAIERLQRAVANGLPARELLTGEELLAGLAGQSEFRELLDDIPDEPSVLPERLEFEEP